MPYTDFFHRRIYYGDSAQFLKGAVHYIVFNTDDSSDEFLEFLVSEIQGNARIYHPHAKIERIESALKSLSELNEHYIGKGLDATERIERMLSLLCIR